MYEAVNLCGVLSSESLNFKTFILIWSIRWDNPLTNTIFLASQSRQKTRDREAGKSYNNTTDNRIYYLIWKPPVKNLQK